MNNQYWLKRLQQVENKIYKNTTNNVDKQLIKKYKQVNKFIEQQISDLYINLLEHGELSLIDLYTYGRYFDLKNNISNVLTRLGIDESKIIQTGLLDAYKNTYISTNTVINPINKSFTIISESMMKNVVNANWSGKQFSERIWDNKKILVNALDKEITNCIGAGMSKDKAIKNIMNVTGRGYRDSQRIIRTELNYVTNQAQKQSYQDNNYTHYEFLAEIDDRTSDICEDLNGKIFAFADAVEGENFPPLHPNCRSTIIPVIE